MGKRRATPGTKQIAAEVGEALLTEFKTFVKSRRETLRDHLELAMRRHLDNPPPPLRPAVPPLPPMPPPEVPPAKPARKGRKT